MDMSVLKCNDYVKFLGVPIDKSLTWGPHIHHAASKINTSVEDTQTTKIIYFLDDVGSMKINGLTITWNIVFCYTKNVETILQPFSIQWGGEQFYLKTHNAPLSTTVTLGTSAQISNAIHKVHQ